MSDQPVVPWEEPRPETGPAPGIEFAPHGPRLVAYLLDSLLLGAILILFTLVGFILLLPSISSDGADQLSPISVVLLWAVLLVAILVSLLYFPFFWASGGQTPGMRPFRLYVVRDSDGTPIGWGSALLRMLGMYVASTVFYLGFAWILVDKRHRGWQDLIAGTVVVKRS
jgi:uncharacterized RDD family membrane protein YckC